MLDKCKMQGFIPKNTTTRIWDLKRRKGREGDIGGGWTTKGGFSVLKLNSLNTTPKPHFFKRHHF